MPNEELTGVLRLGRRGDLAQDFGCGLTLTPANAKAAFAGDPELTPAKRLKLWPVWQTALPLHPGESVGDGMGDG